MQLQTIFVCAILRFYGTKFNQNLHTDTTNDISVRGIGAFAHDAALLSFFLHLCQKQTPGGSV